jgi:hypothetical protein
MIAGMRGGGAGARPVRLPADNLLNSFFLVIDKL